MGNFAQQSLPLSDSVRLTILRRNRTRPETISVGSRSIMISAIRRISTVPQLPYRSRFNPTSKAFTDTASWRANNCVAQVGTNGVDRNLNTEEARLAVSENPSARFQQQPLLPATAGRHLLNVFTDDTPLSNVVLPTPLQPILPPLNGSLGVGQFYMLKDGKTGVLALGSFSDADFDKMQQGLLEGLLSLKSAGATQLVVDVVSWYIDAFHLERCY